MFLQLLFLLCLFPHHVFCMEEGSEGSSVELVELKIDKNKRIKTFDEAYVVANLSPDTWPQYSLSSYCMVGLITLESCAEYQQLAQPIKQQIKDLKKNNPNKYAQLTHEIFTELQHKIQNQDKNMLDELRKERAHQYKTELACNKREIKSLQEWITCFDKNKENCNAFWSHNFITFCCVVNGVFNVVALIFSGVFSGGCWS